MIRSVVLRLSRKLLTLTILLTCLAFINSDMALKKVSASACCDQCASYYVACINYCSQIGCSGGAGECYARYYACVRNYCGSCP
jgi:hypothetical protein